MPAQASASSLPIARLAFYEQESAVEARTRQRGMLIKSNHGSVMADVDQFRDT